MTQTTEQIKKIITPILKEAGVVRAALFGSVARGESTEQSDIDILVEFDKKSIPGFFGFIGLKHKLEDALGKKVDLLTFQSVNPLLKDLIARDEIEII